MVVNQGVSGGWENLLFDHQGQRVRNCYIGAGHAIELLSFSLEML